MATNLKIKVLVADKVTDLRQVSDLQLSPLSYGSDLRQGYMSGRRQGNKDTDATATPTNLVIRRKIYSVLRRLEVSSAGQNVLIQFWAPITTEGRCFLATSDQPFAISDCNEKLYGFKKLCMAHKFYVDTDTEKELGLIGRVFVQKLPELLLDVDAFSGKEYPQLDHVVRCNVKGFVALPVLEPSSQARLGVIEMVFPSHNMYSSYYRHLTNSVFDGLQEVGLQSSVECNHFDKEICDEALKHALHEISKVLKVACKTHRLPLAQTWLPCRDYSVMAHGGSPKNTFILRVSSKAVASYSHFAYEFEWASQMVGLQKGQGVAGRAYLSHRPCLTNDITQFNLAEYPLARYAQDCMLNCCFAICLRSSYTGDNDYVLEFFIPCGKGQPWFRLESLLATLKHNFKSFKLASGQELGEELSVEVINSFMGKNQIYFQKVQAFDFLIDDVGDISPMHSPTRATKSKEEDTLQESVSSSETPPEQAKVSREMQDDEEVMVRIMATFRDHVFEFKYPLSSQSLADLEEELAKRTMLKVGTFMITYLLEVEGEVDFMILINHDVGLKSCMRWLGYKGKTTLRMFVEPVADCPS